MNFLPIYIQPFTNDSNSKQVTHRVLKISQMDMSGMCMNRGSFLRNDNWHKIIEWIFFQFTFNLLWMIQTQEIIGFRVSKTVGVDMRACVGVGWKFLMEWQVTDKIMGSIVFIFRGNLWVMGQTQEIRSLRVLKIHTGIWVDVYELGKVS